MFKNKIAAKVKNIIKDKDERNLYINIFWAFTIKGVSLFISMFSMPLYIRYFNDNDVLGVWYTALSVLSWISMCDLGFGNGLRNRFTEAYTVGDMTSAGKYVSSTYASLTAIILPIIAFGAMALPHVDLNGFFNLSEELVSPQVMCEAVTILAVGIGVSFILKSINSIIYAIQKSSINNFISLFISALPLGYIMIAPSGTIEQNLIRLAIVHALAQNVPLVVASFIVFSKEELKCCRPRVKNVHFSVAKQMLGFGLQFFLAQVFFMVLMSTNELFVTRLFSAADVVEYSVYYKLFTVVGSVFMLALTPLWSKVTKDLANRQYEKIRQTNKILYMISAAAVVAELMLVPVLQIAVNIWLGADAIAVNYGTAIVFALFGSEYILNIVLTTIANGMGELRTQIFFYGIGAVLKIPVCVAMKEIWPSWTVIVLYNCIVLLVFCVYQMFWVKRKLKMLSEIENVE